MPISQAYLIDRVIGWVRENQLPGNSAGGEITADSELLTSGLLDSLAFIELITFIESLDGCRVDLSDAEPGAFSVVKGLCQLALRNRR